jgi:hypothetical protein
MMGKVSVFLGKQQKHSTQISLRVRSSLMWHRVFWYVVGDVLQKAVASVFSPEGRSSSSSEMLVTLYQTTRCHIITTEISTVTATRTTTLRRFCFGLILGRHPTRTWHHMNFAPVCWTFGFHKMLGNSRVAAQLVVSQVVLSSTELIS